MGLMHDAKLAEPVYAKRVVCGVSAAPLAPTRVRTGVLTCRLLLRVSVPVPAGDADLSWDFIAVTYFLTAARGRVVAASLPVSLGWRVGGLGFVWSHSYDAWPWCLPRSQRRRDCGCQHPRPVARLLGWAHIRGARGAIVDS